MDATLLAEAAVPVAATDDLVEHEVVVTPDEGSAKRQPCWCAARPLCVPAVPTASLDLLDSLMVHAKPASAFAVDRAAAP